MWRHRGRFAVAVLGLAVLVSLVVASLARRPRPVNLVVVTLDTTRADSLTAYGLQGAAMPALDRLAREGVVFDQATTVAPLTLPAHASLFTGLFPPAHGVRDNADRPLAMAHTTLAERLRAEGFRTGAFVASVVLAGDRGLGQGFDHYGEVPAQAEGRGLQRRADEVVSEAIEWLAGAADAPFFMWTHLYDPHEPYDPPEPYSTAFHDPYIGEIAFADSQIGRLVEALDARGLLDRTVIVVAADHGESRGDHGERDHGIFVYESVLRVPFIVRAPGIAPRRIGDPVRIVDVMPTMLELFGLDGGETDGVSLLEAMEGRRIVRLEAYAESMYPRRFGWSPLRSLRDGRFKLIEAPRPELYDLERDPFEERNLYQERRPVADAMARRLDQLGRGREQPLTSSEPPVSPALRAQLASLGYVGAGEPAPAPEGAALPDPKDCIAFHVARRQARGAAPHPIPGTPEARCAAPPSS